jgi:competence protein ComEA
MPNQNKIAKVIVFTLMAIIITGISCAYAMDKVNINTAPVEQLMQLDRIGLKYAERIVEYRETIGPFNTPQDIMKVKGIGEKTWQANKDKINV